jgi:hypothetical protein
LPYIEVSIKPRQRPAEGAIRMDLKELPQEGDDWLADATEATVGLMVEMLEQRGVSPVDDLQRTLRTLAAAILSDPDEQGNALTAHHLVCAWELEQASKGGGT